VRAAFFHCARDPLRPRSHHNGVVSHVRRLPARVRGSVGSAFSRPTHRVPGLRAAAVAGRRRGLCAGCGGSSGSRRAAAGRRQDPGGQRNRRLSPGLRRDFIGGGAPAARTQAARREALCRDGARSGRRRDAGRARRRRAGDAGVGRATDCPGQAQSELQPRPRGGARQPDGWSLARLFAAAPPLAFPG
jgi:hypothetical protein